MSTAFIIPATPRHLRIFWHNAAWHAIAAKLKIFHSPPASVFPREYQITWSALLLSVVRGAHSESMFIVESIGSFVVLVLTGIEDVETLPGLEQEEKAF